MDGESDDARVLEHAIEYLKHDLEESKEILAHLQERQQEALADPDLFVKAINDRSINLKSIKLSKAIPVVSRVKYSSVLSDLGRTYDEAFPSRKQFKSSHKHSLGKRKTLANKRINLDDIRSRLADFVSKNKILLRISTGDMSESMISPCQSPAASPRSSNGIGDSRPMSSLSLPSTQRVHFTKTRVSGGFYMAQAGLSSPHMIALESRTIKSQRDGRSTITSQLDQLSALPLTKKLTKEYNDLMKLVREKHSRQMIKSGFQQSVAVHSGYQCDSCHREPITGIRWNCIDCPDENAVDMCDDCYWKRHLLETESACHLETHRFRDIIVADSYWDGDDETYNYLNPNAAEDQ